MLMGLQSCNAEKHKEKDKHKDKVKSEEASNVKTLHSFNGTDGDTPKGTMTLADNTLYGFTSAGGQNNKGVIFSIDTSGSGFKVLYNYEDGDNNGTGNEPHHDAMLSYNNSLYGVTAYGGNGNNGVIFNINTDGSGYKPIHVFTGKKNDGSHPRSGVLELNSVFYGTTAEGGKDGKGVIYKINPDGSEFSILYSFVKSTGHNPHCRLTLGSDGHTVFGTSKTGGSDGVGVVFAFDLSSSQYNVLHTFQKSKDNGYTAEHGFVTRSNKKLFGLTHFGGEYDKGVIYSLNEDGSDFKIMHSFGSDSKDGISPYGSLQLSNGYLYGTTQGGGKDDRGTIFRIDTNGNGYETIFKYEKATTGEYPIDNVVLNSDGSMLYSFGQEGGEFAQTGTKKFGTIISLNLNNLRK
jgi:uncharacterized repeat protein (TIGR03803 family)